MKCVRNTIIEQAILDNLGPELLLVMIYISNLLLIFLLNGLGLYKTSTESPLQLSYLKVLEFIIYVFIYKEEKKAKSTK